MKTDNIFTFTFSVLPFIYFFLLLLSDSVSLCEQQFPKINLANFQRIFFSDFKASGLKLMTNRLKVIMQGLIGTIISICECSLTGATITLAKY